MNPREAQQHSHSHIGLREHECVHASYHPWVEALPVGSLDARRCPTRDDLFRGGYVAVRFAERLVAGVAAERCSKLFWRKCASGSSGFRGDPACMAVHGEAVQVRRRRRRRGHRTERGLQQKVCLCRNRQNKQTTAAGDFRVATACKPSFIRYWHSQRLENINPCAKAECPSIEF